MVLAFHILRRPLSSSAKLARGYMQTLSNAARANYSGPLLLDPLYSRVIWFHRYEAFQGDVDNISKRVHDALKQILFTDDEIITHTMAARINMNGGVVLDPASAGWVSSAALLGNIENPSVSDILYVEVGFQNNNTLFLGPIR